MYGHVWAFQATQLRSECGCSWSLRMAAFPRKDGLDGKEQSRNGGGQGQGEAKGRTTLSASTRDSTRPCQASDASRCLVGPSGLLTFQLVLPGGNTVPDSEELPRTQGVLIHRSPLWSPNTTSVL